MTGREKIESLLKKLARQTTEQPSPAVGEKIKNDIPDKLAAHKTRLDTLNIIIDLRINKFAAAASIAIITAISIYLLFGANSSGHDIFDENRLAIQYLFKSENVANAGILNSISYLHDHLVQQGKEVVFYENSIDPQNHYRLVMHWKMPDGTYKAAVLVFGKLNVQNLTAEQLIELQALMLKRKNL